MPARLAAAGFFMWALIRHLPTGQWGTPPLIASLPARLQQRLSVGGLRTSPSSYFLLLYRRGIPPPRRDI